VRHSLESVLTVYIDSIETGEVVTVHKNLKSSHDGAWYDAPDPAKSGIRFARDIPNAILANPASGHAKKQGIVYPWICVSSTETESHFESMGRARRSHTRTDG